MRYRISTYIPGNRNTISESLGTLSIFSVSMMHPGSESLQRFKALWLSSDPEPKVLNKTWTMVLLAFWVEPR